MADDLEKFVLQYNVDLKDSINRLEQLQARMGQTGQSAESAAARGGHAFDGLAQRIVGTGGDVRALGAEFTQAGVKAGMMGSAAATGIAAVTIALAYAIAQTRKLNEEFQRTKTLAFEIGTTSMNVMQNRRTYGGAGLRADEADHISSTISNRVSAAYISMDPASEDAIRLRAAGIHASDSNGQRTSTAAAQQQLEQKLRSVSETQAYVIGNTIGLTQREVQAIRARNDATDKATKFTDAETVRMYEAMKASDQLTTAQVRMDTAIDSVGQKVGAMFLPIWAKMDTAIAEFLEGMPQKLEAFGEGYAVFSAEFEQAMNMIQEPWKFANKNWGDEITNAGKEALEKRRADYAATLAEAKKNTDAAEKQKAASDQMERNIKNFGAAVSSFTNYANMTNDEAAANWAADVGAANGLKGMGNGMDTRPAWQRQAGGYGEGSSKDVTDLMTGGARLPAEVRTVGDLVDNKKGLLAHNPAGTATGIYQITADTFRQFGEQALGKNWREADVRSPQVQDEVARAIWDSAKNNPRAISGRWASISDMDARKMKGMPWEQARDIISLRESGYTSGQKGPAAPVDATKGMNNMNPYGKPQARGVGGSPDFYPYAETFDTRLAQDAHKRQAAMLGVPVAQLNSEGGVSNIDKSNSYHQMNIDAMRNLIATKSRYEQMQEMKRTGAGKFSPQAMAKAADDYQAAQYDYRGVQLLGQGVPGGGVGYENIPRTGTQTLTVNMNFASNTPFKEVLAAEAELRGIIERQSKGHANDIVNNSNSGVSH